MTKLSELVEYRRLTCVTCGVVYFFSEDWCRRAAEQGKTWHCPNGHSQWFGEGEEDKLRREHDRLKQQIAQRDDEIAAERRRTAAAKGENTKLKKRVGNGVCPCCTRSFINLKRHISIKHPDYNVVPLKAEVA